MAVLELEVARLISTAPMLGRDIISIYEAPEVTVLDIEAFEVCLRQLFDYYYFPQVAKEARVAHYLEHEGDHIMAAHKLGARLKHYGIRAWLAADSADDTSALLGYQPFALIDNTNIESDPLRNAAILLYPSKPSEADISKAEAFGYDVDKLGFEAVRYNGMHGDVIPVPRSYIPAPYIVDLAS